MNQVIHRKGAKNFQTLTRRRRGAEISNATPLRLGNMFQTFPTDHFHVVVCVSATDISIFGLGILGAFAVSRF